MVGRVDASLQGQTVVNTATISGDQPDPVASNDSSSAGTEVDPPAAADFDLSLRKTLAAPRVPKLGDVLRYRIAVTNHGPATAHAVRVVDTLPGSLRFRAGRDPGWQLLGKGRGPHLQARVAERRTDPCRQAQGAGDRPRPGEEHGLGRRLGSRHRSR